MKFLLLLCAALGLGNAAASDLDFTLVNHTNRSFEGLYLTASTNKDWDGNLLPEGRTLAAGGKLAVKFDAKSKASAWDLNIVDADGIAVAFDHLKLSGASVVTLEVVDGRITAEVE